MNKAFAMILAALAFAAFAVDTNRVTMTRLGSLNPRSGEVVTDVNFSGIAMTGDVAKAARDSANYTDRAVANYLPLSGGNMTGGLTVPNLTAGTRKRGSAVGANSVAEGGNATASGVCSHAEGNYATASEYYSHAEGFGSTASGAGAHAEGSGSTASGAYSHAEGSGSTASGDYSHAEGEGSRTQNNSEHAQGHYNASHKASGIFGNAGNTLSSIGFGAGDNVRKNAVETMQDGKTFIYGLGGYDGTNPTGTGVQDLATAFSILSSALDGKLDKTGGTLTGALIMNAPIVIRGNGLRGVQFDDIALYLLDDNGLPSRVLPYSEIVLTSDIPTTMAWSAITGKPTTISGYGITDALKSDFVSLTNNTAFTSAVAAVSPPTDLTHVEAEIETNRTAIATLSARAYIDVVSADEVYYVFTTNQE